MKRICKNCKHFQKRNMWDSGHPQGRCDEINYYPIEIDSCDRFKSNE